MKEDKRSRILKAAIKVFASDGFYHAKVEKIAKLAGVATGTPYLYFENKDDILISIFEEEMNPIIDESKDVVLKKSSAKEKIIEFIEHHFKMIQANPEMAILLEVELRQSSRFIRNYKGSKFKEYLDVIAKCFEDGQRNGEFRKDISSTIFKQMLFGALDQIAINWTLSKTRKIDLDESARQISTVLLDGIAATE